MVRSEPFRRAGSEALSVIASCETSKGHLPICRVGTEIPPVSGNSYPDTNPNPKLTLTLSAPSWQKANRASSRPFFTQEGRTHTTPPYGTCEALWRILFPSNEVWLALRIRREQRGLGCAQVRMGSQKKAEEQPGWNRYQSNIHVRRLDTSFLNEYNFLHPK